MNPAQLRDSVVFQIPQREKNELGRFEEFGDVEINRRAKIDWKGSRPFVRRDLSGTDVEALVAVRKSALLSGAKTVRIDEQTYRIIQARPTEDSLFQEFQIQKI